jgi:hypothetical protein
MTWKRLALAYLLGFVALPLGYYLSKAASTWWYMRTDPDGDGQVGLSIFVGSLFMALICGLVTFGAVLIQGHQRR